MTNSMQPMGLANAAAMPKCESCDSPSVMALRDRVQVRPVQDADGNWHPSWRPDGGPHFFCKAHQREPERRDGPEYDRWAAEHPELVAGKVG